MADHGHVRQLPELLPAPDRQRGGVLLHGHLPAHVEAGVEPQEAETNVIPTKTDVYKINSNVLNSVLLFIVTSQ